MSVSLNYILEALLCQRMMHVWEALVDDCIPLAYTIGPHATLCRQTKVPRNDRCRICKKSLTERNQHHMNHS